MNTNIEITNINLKQAIANNFPFKIEGFLHMILDIKTRNFFCSYKIGVGRPEIFTFELQNDTFVLGFESINNIDSRTNLINWLINFEGSKALLNEYIKFT